MTRAHQITVFSTFLNHLIGCQNPAISGTCAQLCPSCTNRALFVVTETSFWATRAILRLSSWDTVG